MTLIKLFIIKYILFIFYFLKIISGQLSDVPLQVVVWPLYARQGKSFIKNISQAFP